MFFLLRTAFWLTLVLVLIPLGSGQKNTSDETVDPVSAYLAAQATVTDIGGFCNRNPQACETGGNALSAIGSRARDGARIVYEYLDAKVPEGPEMDQPVSVLPDGSSAADVPFTATVPVPMIPDAVDVQPTAETIVVVPRPKP